MLSRHEYDRIMERAKHYTGPIEGLLEGLLEGFVEDLPLNQCFCFHCKGEWLRGDLVENHKFDCPTGKGGLNLQTLWNHIKILDVRYANLEQLVNNVISTIESNTCYKVSRRYDTSSTK